MAEEMPEGLPEELSAWVAHRAEETGRDREEVLSRAVAAYRLVSEHEGSLPVEGADVADVESRLSAFDERLAAVESAVDDTRSDVDEKITDVRQRVVEVMRTAKSKADADHGHEDLEGDLAEVQEDLTDLESTVDGGFDNFEAILTDLSDTTDELDEKATQLAHAVVDLRKRMSELEAENARRAAVDDLKEEANRRGITTATCQDCGTKVQVGLLASPGCPHCGSVFDGIEGSAGFLSSPTLTVGRRPALEGERVEDPDPEDLFDDV